MAKVTITIEDMDTGVDVQLRFENPNRITQMPSAENTLEALRELRNEQFRNEFMLLTEQQGISRLMAMSQLCPKYQISERTGYTIVRGGCEPVTRQETLF